MSPHDTCITGLLSRPHPLSSGLCLQALAATQASHSAKVTSYFPAAKALAMVTVRCGPSSSERPSSPNGDPIVKLPAGTTTISGHSSHSLKLSLGLSARSSADVNGFTIGLSVIGGIGRSGLEKTLLAGDAIAACCSF